MQNWNNIQEHVQRCTSKNAKLKILFITMLTLMQVKLESHNKCYAWIRIDPII